MVIAFSPISRSLFNIFLKKLLELRDISLLNMILTHPVNFPCGREQKHPEKTDDFRQSVDSFHISGHSFL